MIASQDILDVTSNVMNTMLQFPVEPAAELADDAKASGVSGCVQISGEWNGAVVFKTTEAFASQAAMKLLMLKDANVSHEDRQDTIAELTNMIGGNIKSIVPGPSFLSLPSVTIGQDFDFRLFGAQVVNSIPFECLGEKMRIIVCEGGAKN